MIDATRDFAAQAKHLVRIDALLLTHGHPDAFGGLPSLRRWWVEQNSSSPIDVFLGKATAQIIRTRYRHLEHCRLQVVAPGQSRHVALST